MKKVVFTILTIIVGITTINAQNEYFYVNNQGVRFTKNQYDYFSEMYFDGYQECMTQQDFDFFDINLMDKELVKTSYSNQTNPMATQIVSGGKTLKISKTAENNRSYITTTLLWNSEPTIKSYDVVGAYLDGVSLIGSVSTKMVNDKETSSYSINVSSNNGFGTSVLLSGNNIKITQTFRVTNGGKVYASYQHAMSSISLNNSKKYTFSKSGYGEVFKFSGSAINIYDQMNGVNISV